MKRPPPDSEARVFVASQHTDAVLAAQDEVLRHHASRALSRVNSDMREGVYVGAMLISEASRKIVHWSALGFRVAATRTRAWAALAVEQFSAAASRTRTGALHVRFAVGRRLTLLRDGAVRVSVGAASLTKRGAGHVGRVLSVGALFTWRWTTKILLGASLMLLAVGLALAAILVGLVGAFRSGLVLLLKVIRQSLTRSTGTRTDVEPVRVHSAPRGASMGARFTDEVSRLRVTVRWHSRAAGPLVVEAIAAFVNQIGRSFRLAPQPRRAAMVMAVAVGLIALGAYGSLNRRYQPASAPVAAKLTSNSPTTASEVPAPVQAEAIDPLRTIKERSIELLTPAGEGRPGLHVEPSRASVGSARVDDSPRQADAMLGSLLIASAPKGASVSVDGIPHGQAPVSIRRLRAGNRLVRVELDGYRRWSWAVYVTPSRQTTVNVSLVPENGTSPTSAVTNSAAFAK
jgi:hypothetical protein